ncbi:hypothetical protein ACFVXG_28455 [Kitasatospora sp. NPDC058162]|uniref:hypothetical protein n=1 Tax=Kitasatospora sp. NPDC058162 TaxID=3346362 RepID=UPI0036DEC6AB
MTLSAPGPGLLDRAGHLAVHRHAGTVFDLTAQLPDQVFRTPRPDTLFCDFERFIRPEIWPALQGLARLHGDDRIELLVLRPDAESYHLPEYGVHPSVSLPVEGSEDDYWAAIGFEPNDDFAGSLAVAADVITVTGPSGRWGCWADRGPEVAVFQGFPDRAALRAWHDGFGPFQDVTEALEFLLPPVFRGTVPTAYAARLTTNYG